MAEAKILGYLQPQAIQEKAVWQMYLLCVINATKYTDERIGENLVSLSEW